MKPQKDVIPTLGNILDMDKRRSRSGHRDDSTATITEALPRSKSRVVAELGLEFEDLTYTVVKEEKIDGKWKSTDVNLLQEISGKAIKGQLTAIMGPSGAGKSTFLDALAGRIDQQSLGGTVWLDGHEVTGSYIERNSAYVLQQDFLFPFLSVAETLMFAAEVRLPSTLSRSEKADRVQALITQLGLERCAQTHVGDEKHRGISGGEKRRVSIGVDIIHGPSLLFLDEPTSGLDSTSALIVVEKLGDIAGSGSTVLLTIHQPSYRIQMMFSRIIILARGRMVYQGAPDELAAYIEAIGKDVPQNENDVEYFMEIINDYEQSDAGLDPLVQFHRNDNRTIPTEKSSLPSSNFAARTPTSEELGDGGGGFDHSLTSMRTPLKRELKPAYNFYTKKVFLNLTPLRVSAFHKSSTNPVEVLGQGRSIETLYSGVKEENEYASEGNAGAWTYQNGWLREVMILMWRSSKNVIRSPALFISREIKAVVLSILLATLLKNPKKNVEGVNQLIAYFVFVLTLVFFSCNDALPTFIEERYIFIKETGSKAYRASSYSVASLLVYLPTNAVHAVSYVLITWWALKLDGGVKGFLIFFLIVFSSVVTANSFAMLVSAVVPNIISGYAVVIALTSFSFLTCGYFVKRSEIPVFWIWLHYMSTMKYSLEAALQNEFTKGKCFSTSPARPAPGPLESISQFSPLPVPNGTTSSDCYLFGENVVEALDVNQFTIMEGIALLLMWTFIYRVLLYIVLRFYSKSQRKSGKERKVSSFARHISNSIFSGDMYFFPEKPKLAENLQHWATPAFGDPKRDPPVRAKVAPVKLKFPTNL